MAHQLNDRHYVVLNAHERFRLMLEAMARKDEPEADKLEDTCPRRMYRAEDQEFRARMVRSHLIVTQAWLTIGCRLAQLRVLGLFHDQRDLLLQRLAESLAVDVLSQWKGFGGFCQEVLGFDPLMIVRAFGLGHDDPEAQVRAILPQTTADRESAAKWAQRWTRTWERRFAD